MASQTKGYEVFNRMTTEGQSPSDWMAGLTTATRDGTQTPIRHGHGKLKAVDPQPIENSNGRMRLSFKFDDGEVCRGIVTRQ